ncbi:MAG TPA: aspartate aminotransferase family protein, partial [Gemmatimonadales bacterium]|nr:aspartate aminotransferase family protein [Gemmatimonadales bacterium]
ADVMAHLAPEGPVYQAGTLSGNPVAVAAGRAALDLVCSLDPFAALTARAEGLAAGISAALAAASVRHTVNRVGSLFSVFFTDRAVSDYDGAKRADHERYARFFHGLLERGVYLPPSGFEAWFLSTAHGDAESERTLDAVAAVAHHLG